MAKKKKPCCGNCFYGSRMRKDTGWNWKTDIMCYTGASFNFGEVCTDHSFEEDKAQKGKDG